MKSQTNIHHTVPVDTLADLYANRVGSLQEQTWPNRSNGPPISEKLLNSHHHDRHEYCWCSDMSFEAYLNDNNNTKPEPYNQFTKDDILISAASETGYSLVQLYKECLFLSMEKTAHYCERLPYSDEKEISLNL